MDPLTIALIAAGVGGVLGGMGAEEKRKSIKAQRPIEAVKAKWYGWNKEAPRTFQDPNMLAEILQGGLGGFTGGVGLADTMGKSGFFKDQAKLSKADMADKTPEVSAPAGTRPVEEPLVPVEGKMLPARERVLRRELASLDPSVAQTVWYNLLPASNQYYRGY